MDPLSFKVPIKQGSHTYSITTLYSVSPTNADHGHHYDDHSQSHAEDRRSIVCSISQYSMCLEYDRNTTRRQQSPPTKAAEDSQKHYDIIVIIIVDWCEFRRKLRCRNSNIDWDRSSDHRRVSFLVDETPTIGTVLSL